ncbi:hypothetical protein DFH08DRAFT_800040 [Mycena albidolilacea]|uniref:Uncharacterized protein n=1 Tax=Mycena albidolilacea TaxID=1033008 RepID=A0AAD7AMK6_9AGAR|nr:hypothetical protein DFH08DRAFT_800040 [Mycena albidolilacea]
MIDVKVWFKLGNGSPTHRGVVQHTHNTCRPQVAALFPLRAAHDCRPLAAKGGTGGNGGTFTVPGWMDTGMDAGVSRGADGKPSRASARKVSGPKAAGAGVPLTSAHIIIFGDLAVCAHKDSKSTQFVRECAGSWVFTPNLYIPKQSVDQVFESKRYDGSKRFEFWHTERARVNPIDCGQKIPKFSLLVSKIGDGHGHPDARRVAGVNWALSRVTARRLPTRTYSTTHLAGESEEKKG